MKKTVDALFIKPADKADVYGKLSSSLSAVEPPLWAALIASYVREKGFSVAMIDAEADGLSPERAAREAADYKPLLTVFVVTGSNLSASTWNMTGTRSYIKALQYALPDTKTMLWGLHASSLPERTLIEEGADFVCQGEGFITISGLLSVLKSGVKTDRYDVPGLWYLRDGKSVSNPRGALIEDLDELPPAAWELLPMDKYRAHNWHCFDEPGQRQPYGVIYTSLGCPFNCSFCALGALFGGPGVRYRSPSKVIADIGALVGEYNVRNIKVLDECFVLKEDHVNEICDLIVGKRYDLNIWAYARVDTVNEALLKKMARAGFRWLCYGIESGNKSNLSKVDKRGFGKDEIRRAVKMTKAAGINVLGNFIFGLPDDDLAAMREALDFAIELNCEYANFYAMMAYPGSRLYEMACRENVRLPNSWRGYSAFSRECVPLPTKYLSSEDILSFRDEAFVEYHSHPDYLSLVEKKFGSKALGHVREMLGHKIERDILKDYKQRERI